MKILMLTPYLPYPPSSGGQVRSYNLIKQLSKKHKITLYSLIKHDSEREYIPKLEQYCQEVKVFKRAEKPWTLSNIIKTGMSLKPFLVIRNFSEQEKEALIKALAEGNFDMIHAETFYVSPHIPKTTIPTVLVDQTIEYQVYQHYVKHFKYKFLKPLLWIDVLKIKYWETFYWKRARRVVAVSESDAKKMRELVPGLKVAVVPNGVGEDLIEDIPLHYSKNILLMGNYEWLQNKEAAMILAKKVFPLILEKLPDAKLIIAGQHIEKVLGLESPGVELLDLKIEDVDGVKKAYRESGILVAPLYGPGGTRLKILGAMAARTPVVTTDIGIEGIEAINGESALFGKTPRELAELVIKVLNDRYLYKKIADNARKLIEEKYTYATVAKKLDDIYQETQSE